ncbi:MAG: hypothetical protein ACLU61_02915 [Lachnospiraceae bacterium]
MPDLRCQAVDCVFNKNEDCTADKIRIENNTCCRSYCDDPKTENKGCECK